MTSRVFQFGQTDKFFLRYPDFFDNPGFEDRRAETPPLRFARLRPSVASEA